MGYEEISRDYLRLRKDRIIDDDIGYTLNMDPFNLDSSVETGYSDLIRIKNLTGDMGFINPRFQGFKQVSSISIGLPYPKTLSGRHSLERNYVGRSS